MSNTKENKTTWIAVGFVCVFVILLCQIMWTQNHASKPEGFPKVAPWVGKARGLCDTDTSDPNQGEINDAIWREEHGMKTHD